MGFFSKIKGAVSKVGSSVSSAVRSASSSISSAVRSVGSNIGGFAGTVLSGVDSFKDWENIAMGALNGIASGDITGTIAGIGSAIAGNALNERAEKRAKEEELRSIAEANAIQRQMDEKTEAYNKAALEYNKAANKFKSEVVNSVRSSSPYGVGSAKDSWKVIYNKFTEKLKSSLLVKNGLSSDSSISDVLGSLGSSVVSAVNAINAK